jgi:hypothetical protein
MRGILIIKKSFERPLSLRYSLLFFLMLYLDIDFNIISYIKEVS